MAGFVSSCRKNVLPPQVVTPPPPPPPPPPEPEPEPEPEPDIVETEPPVQTGVSVTINSMVKGYYQSLPARYNDSNNTKKYPVIVFFHGGGQYGNGTTDLPEILTEGIPKLIDQ